MEDSQGNPERLEVNDTLISAIVFPTESSIAADTGFALLENQPIS
jgi:hypothetical protein